MSLVRHTYELTSSWPSDERFGLTSQTRRAAVSIPSNVAEGAGRGTNADFARFVRTGVGSVCEYETLILIAIDLGYTERTAALSSLEAARSIRKMLRRLEQSLTGNDYARTTSGA